MKIKTILIEITRANMCCINWHLPVKTWTSLVHFVVLVNEICSCCSNNDLLLHFYFNMSANVNIF